jgi:hypothetical protein
MAAGGMRVVGSLLACSAVLSSPRLGAAAPLLVEWQAPPCAEQAAFRSRVRDALRRDPDSALERELQVTIVIREAREKSGYSLRIRTSAGERELDLSSCDEAVVAAATVVALAIDPNAVTETESAAKPEEPAPSPAPAPAAAPGPAPRRREPVPSKPAREARLEPHLAAFAGASIGDVPALSPLLGASVGLRFRRLTFGAEGFWIAPQTELLPGTTKGGDIGLWGGGASACYLLLQGPWSVRGCLAAQAGAWRSRGVGVENPVGQSDWWAAGVARLGAGGRLHASLGLFLTADVVVPARRPSFKLEALGQVFRPNVVAGRVASGVELNF